VIVGLGRPDLAAVLAAARMVGSPISAAPPQIGAKLSPSRHNPQ